MESEKDVKKIFIEVHANFGSDEEGDGTIGKPFKTIARAISFANEIVERRKGIPKEDKEQLIINVVGVTGE